jgi:hypothetical protein
VSDVKYIVYPVGSDEPLEPGTYFVLRSSDMFGAPVLYAYDALIRTVLEFAREWGTLSSEQMLTLEELSDFVLGLAQEWQRQGRGRLPTP